MLLKKRRSIRHFKSSEQRYVCPKNDLEVKYIFDKNVNLQVCISKGHDFVDQKRLYNYFKNKAPFFIFFWPMKKFINRDMCLIESNVKQKEINETCNIIELFLIFKT